MADKQLHRDEANCFLELECWVPDPGGSRWMCNLKCEYPNDLHCTNIGNSRNPNAATLWFGDSFSPPTSSLCAQNILIVVRISPTQSSSREADCFLQTCIAIHVQQHFLNAKWILEYKGNDQPVILTHRNIPGHRERDLGYQNFDILLAVEIHVWPSCRGRLNCDRQCTRSVMDLAWFSSRTDELIDPCKLLVIICSHHDAIYTLNVSNNSLVMVRCDPRFATFHHEIAPEILSPW